MESLQCHPILEIRRASEPNELRAIDGHLDQGPNTNPAYRSARGINTSSTYRVNVQLPTY